jgi:hypothetical protein
VIVRIDPVHAVDAGAKWSLDGGAWNDSGSKIDFVRAGVHGLTFRDIRESGDWLTPPTITFTLLADAAFATNAVYLPTSNDTDRDELPDEWEITQWGRLTSANANSDWDSDGLPDYYEWLSGTNPKDANSCIAFVPGGISGAAVQGVLLRWYSGAGMSYQVLRSTDLSAGFQAIDANVAATPPVNFYTDQSGIGDGPYFYRIQLNR